MKQFIVFTIIIGLIIATFMFVYNSNIAKIKMNQEYIAQYSSYFGQKITGTELVTLMNRIVDNNEKLNIEKTEEGKYLEDTQQAIRLEILFTDNEETYSLESVYESGASTFMEFYGSINFICEHIEYYDITKNVKLMSFKQTK